MSQQTLCKNQFSFRLVGVRILFCVDLTWNDPNVSVWLKIWRKLLSINILSSYHALLVLVVNCMWYHLFITYYTDKDQSEETQNRALISTVHNIP